MWQLRRSECERLLATLVDSGFLARTSNGAFVRSGSGRRGA
jgi:DNA-binding IclR family transcriptional regulator